MRERPPESQPIRAKVLETEMLIKSADMAMYRAEELDGQAIDSKASPSIDRQLFRAAKPFPA
jgi:hypothetical protein